MFDKYENKTYNEYIQSEIPNLEIKKTNIIEKDNIKDTINTKKQKTFSATS